MLRAGLCTRRMVWGQHRVLQHVASLHIPHGGLLKGATPGNDDGKTSESKDDGGDAAPADKGGATSRFRTLWRRYGWVGVSTYLGVYVTTLSGLYVTVKAGGIVPGDVSELVKDSHIAAFHLPGLSTTDLTVTKSTGDFALAWIATKLTEPLRLALTLAITPSISRGIYSLRRRNNGANTIDNAVADDDEDSKPKQL